MSTTIGLRMKVELRSKTVHFQKLGRGDTNFYMQGWGSSVHDPQALLDYGLHSKDAVTPKGGVGHGRIADAELDRLIDAASTEMDAQRRGALIAAAPHCRGAGLMNGGYRASNLGRRLTAKGRHATTTRLISNA